MRAPTPAPLAEASRAAGRGDAAAVDEALVRTRIAVIQRTLKVISGKWKLEVLLALHDGPRRFNELRRVIPGVTQHILAVQLRDLEAAGIVVRRAYAEMPPRVEYEITEAGLALRPIAEAMIAWGEAHGRDERGG